MGMFTEHNQEPISPETERLLCKMARDCTPSPDMFEQIRVAVQSTPKPAWVKLVEQVFDATSRLQPKVHRG